MSENVTSIKRNVEIALANSGSHVSASDLGAVATLLRLSQLLDDCFDVADLDRIPALLQRHLALMESLKLTPKSRAVVGQPVKESTDYGKEITERYLRLIPSAPAKQTSKRPKSGTSGSGTSGKPRNATNGVAKKRTGSGTSN